MNHSSQIRLTNHEPLRFVRHSGFGFLSAFVIGHSSFQRFMVPMHGKAEGALSMNRGRVIESQTAMGKRR